ncbi:MAG: nuclear transport factor 2 family protein, partial [Thermodesulfobacteriota bacterium]
EYTLNNFKVTQNGPAIIVTYTASVQEMIAGENLDKQSERLSVWIKTDKGWQWITHANLVPLKN